MWARATRVEFIIVSVALLVLLLCSNPPRSGKADVEDMRESGSVQPIDAGLSESDLADDANDAEETPAADQLGEDEPSETLSTTPLREEAMPAAPRMAAVDATGCNDLDYKNVMYGQVTVRWVWNGTKFVPQKVCVVEEEDGVTSVWSFDQQDDAVLSELSEPPTPPR
jgi:hypothetical protein